MTSLINLECLHCKVETTLDLTNSRIMCDYCGAIYNIKMTEKELTIDLTGTYWYPTKVSPK